MRKYPMGGNVFKSFNGEPATQRIAKDSVLPTVRWLESITGLGLADKMLGTTGINDTSGDIDVAVDSNLINKDVLIQTLIKKGIPPIDIKKSGDSVHLRTPIEGDPDKGYVQTDFMFGDPQWLQFSMIGSLPESIFRGAHRHILLASIAKAQNLKWSYKHGLVNRDTNLVVSQNPTEIAQILFNGTADDLSSIESIIERIRTRPDYEMLVKDARDTFEKENLKLPSGEPTSEGSSEWFSQWKQRL